MWWAHPISRVFVFAGLAVLIIYRQMVFVYHVSHQFKQTMFSFSVEIERHLTIYRDSLLLNFLIWIICFGIVTKSIPYSVRLVI